MRLVIATLIFATFVCASSCSRIFNKSNSPKSAIDSVADISNGITFTDITVSSGITWRHCNGAFGQMYLPEIKGSGCAIIDYNNDGWPDLLFVNSMHWPGHTTLQEPTMALYRNNRDGTFTDVTKECGLAIPLFGMGVTVGDYDNDGWDDIFITAYGHNHLFHNDKGVFTDVTQKAGLAGDSNWHSSAMFLDYDNDGKLDLFVCSYCGWTPENDIFYSLGGNVKTYGAPDVYPALTNHLYHNNGNGTFTDVTRKSGIYNMNGKALAVAMCDFNDDGYPDIVVACDDTDNMLYRNNTDGTFTNIANHAGIAYDINTGKRRSGMGVDCGDLDNDGKTSIVIGNFYTEPDWVYKQTGPDTFVDCAAKRGIDTITRTVLKFAVTIADFDHDGFLDFLTADGHVRVIDEFHSNKVKFREPMQLFRNLGNGKFAEIVSLMHGPMQNNILGRGIALGDLFNSGNEDVVVTTNDSTPMVLRNDTKNGNSYLEVHLCGVHANRDGIGAKITAICPNWRQVQFVHSGSSYASASELDVNFGMGKNKRVDTLIVRWGAHSIDTLTNIPTQQSILITENKREYSTISPQR